MALSAQKTPLYKHQQCCRLRFCSKHKLLSIPSDQRHYLDCSDGSKEVKPESKFREATRHSEVRTRIKASSPLSWNHSHKHAITVFVSSQGFPMAHPRKNRPWSHVLIQTCPCCFRFVRFIHKMLASLVVVMIKWGAAHDMIGLNECEFHTYKLLELLFLVFADTLHTLSLICLGSILCTCLLSHP